MAHRVFILFLVLVGLSAAVAIGIHGSDYYRTPLPDRPFRADHALMRPSGGFSHGLGILGAAMITIGVAMYSSRKRVKALWGLGRLSRWLEIHIFLCLLGPVLIVYHTTFKAGGIAAISLWTMLTVMSSGIMGRFLYVLIPRNRKGAELSGRQIDEEFDRIAGVLNRSPQGRRFQQEVDRQFAAIRRPENLRETVGTYLLLGRMKRQVKRSIRRMIQAEDLPHETARTLRKATSARAALIQRSVLLGQVEKLFFYWDAIHLPFTVMMFVTLAAHVGVALWLGYRWVL